MCKIQNSPSLRERHRWSSFKLSSIKLPKSLRLFWVSLTSTRNRVDGWKQGNGGRAETLYSVVRKPVRTHQTPSQQFALRWMTLSIFWKGCRPLHTAGWTHEDQRPKRWTLRILLSPLSKTRLSLMSHIYKVLEKIYKACYKDHTFTSVISGSPNSPIRKWGRPYCPPAPCLLLMYDT